MSGGKKEQHRASDQIKIQSVKQNSADRFRKKGITTNAEPCKITVFQSWN